LPNIDIYDCQTGWKTKTKIAKLAKLR